MISDASTVAEWMIAHGYATGHGDTVADMLGELEHQAKSRALSPFTDADLERAVRAYDHVKAKFNFGREAKNYDEYRIYRIACMRAALEALGERT